MRNVMGWLAIVSVTFAASGCVPLIIGGGAETASLAAQERTPGMALDDSGILIKLKNEFAHADKDLFLNVIIKVTEGRVLLTGNVDKPDSQIEAVRIAWTVNGVREVMNEIQVNDQAGFSNYMRDVWISTQIRNRLIFEKYVHSLNYSVITVNQVAYLMGIAQDQDELDRVTYVASTTSYVTRVVSYVRLKDDPRRPVAPPAQPGAPSSLPPPPQEPPSQDTPYPTSNR